MITRKSIRRNIRQTIALAERNILFETRFKLYTIANFIGPIVQILMPLIIFGAIFSLNSAYSFGYWTSQNYFLFILLAFIIQFLRQIIENFRFLFLREKYWKTLQALLVAPINRYVLLFGVLISEMILISIPIIFFFIVAIIVFPITFLNLLLVLIILASISIIFGSIGLILGIIFVTQEGVQRILKIGLTFVFWLSCISYPIQIFPEIVQNVILINPFYYIIDLFRIVWLIGVDYNLAMSFLTPIHIILICLLTFSLPVISVYLFNKFYDKFGISGY